MSTTIAVEHNKLPEHVAIEEPRVAKVRQKPAKRTKFSFIMHNIYDEILETAKTVLIILSVLAICKFAGLFDWWMHLVGNIL